MLLCDAHNHLLHNMGSGAATLDESLTMARALYIQGVRYAIVCPAFHESFETVNRFLTRRNEARKQGKEIEGTYRRDLSEAKKRIAEIKAKMKDLESQIEERFVSFYKRMRQSQKGALVVPLQGTNCGGCFNDIPYGLLQKMDDNGIIDCPHCGRLIYKHQND